MLVWVYPEKKREEFGAIRWTVSWYVLKPGVDPESEWDPYSATREVCRGFKTHAAAMREARRAYDSGDASLFGCVEIQKQRVDWYVEEDRIAEWVNIGEHEELSE